ncbi:MAG: carboxypeptidase-like regulatory domain-containing protein [Myxococcales bacterium]|nr:carboxypeptidase-like regulatory domain-containing protein [Myxococcales bacterium]
MTRCAWTHRWAVLWGLLAAAQGCAFESADALEDSAELQQRNACEADSDCGEGASCFEGLCVADELEAPLEVIVEVVPERGPGGSDSLPVVMGRMEIHASTVMDFELPESVQLQGQIRADGEPIAAEVSFVPLRSMPGRAPALVSATTADALQEGSGDADYSVRLLTGRDYRMVVRPSSPQYPPLSRELEAGAEPMIAIDYGEVATRRQSFRVEGAPQGRTLILRAFDPQTGEPVSSAAPLLDGQATIAFSPGVLDYELELRAEEAYDTFADAAVDCDRPARTLPTLRIPSDSFEEPLAEHIQLTLPAMPTTIRYEGSVEFCPEALGGEAAPPTDLPMTLRSSEVLLDAAAGALTGSFSANATASLDDGGQQLRFCVELIAGQYEVIVTPPQSSPCAIFAEQRLIKAPDGKASRGALLQLPAAAQLVGSVHSPEMAMVAGAVIEANALGRSEGPTLEEGDATLLRFNRSQQTTTDEEGAFRVPVDLGSYDVTIKPPEGSGFAWRLQHDVHIGARATEFMTRIDLVSPLSLRGHVRYPEPLLQETLAGALLRAYVVIQHPDGRERAIPIGKTTADEEGAFLLLLPPAVRAGW